MGLLTNNKLLTETENIAPKKAREPKPEPERSPAPKKKNNNVSEKANVPVKKYRRNTQRRPAKDDKPVLAQKEPREVRSAPVRFISLGGLNEIGKNLYVYECSNDMFIVDCGLAFPDEEMPGVDLVVPDFTYLEKNKDKFRGIVITHGH